MYDLNKHICAISKSEFRIHEQRQCCGASTLQHVCCDVCAVICVLWRVCCDVWADVCAVMCVLWCVSYAVWAAFCVGCNVCAMMCGLRGVCCDVCVGMCVLCCVDCNVCAAMCVLLCVLGCEGCVVCAVMCGLHRKRSPFKAASVKHDWKWQAMKFLGTWITWSDLIWLSPYSMYSAKIHIFQRKKCLAS